VVTKIESRTYFGLPVSADNSCGYLSFKSLGSSSEPDTPGTKCASIGIAIHRSTSLHDHTVAAMLGGAVSLESLDFDSGMAELRGHSTYAHASLFILSRLLLDWQAMSILRGSQDEYRSSNPRARNGWSLLFMSMEDPRVNNSSLIRPSHSKPIFQS